MDPQIEQMLKDLYSYDPEFMKHEEKLKNILSELLKVKPETKFDPSFAEDLRKILLLKAEDLKNETASKPAFSFFRQPYLTLGAGFAVVVLAFLTYTFIPKGIGWDESTFEMYIFDRWGEMIYSCTDVNKPWDGRVQGSANIGTQEVYVWLVNLKDIKGAIHSFNGRVTVIR